MTTEELAALCERLLATGDDMECVIEAVDAIEALGGEVRRLMAENDLLRSDFDALVDNRDSLRAELADCQSALSETCTAFAVEATETERLRAQLATAVEALWAIQEFTNGYDDVAGVTHRKAREALTRLEGPDPLDPVDSPQPPLV